MHRALRRLLPPALLLLAAACTPVTFAAQDLALRLDRTAGTATVELVSRDLRVPTGGRQEQNDREALAFLRRVLAGERLLILGDQVEIRDLDLLAEQLDAAAARGSAAPDPALVAVRAFLASVRVVEATLERADDGTLRLRQRFEVGDPDALVAAVNGFVAGRLAAVGASDLASARDRASAAIARRDLEAGADWLAWDERGLVLRVPIRSTDLVELLRGSSLEEAVLPAVDHAGGAADAYRQARWVLGWARYWAGLVRDLRVEPEHLVLVLGDPAGATVLTWDMDAYLRDLGVVGEDDDPAEFEAQMEEARAHLAALLEAEGITLPATFRPGG